MQNATNGILNISSGEKSNFFRRQLNRLSTNIRNNGQDLNAADIGQIIWDVYDASKQRRWGNNGIPKSQRIANEMLRAPAYQHLHQLSMVQIVDN